MSGHHESEAYWDDDSRMALGRSHGRTMASLEEAAFESDRVSRRPKTKRGNRDQILPSPSNIRDEAEEAKQRTHQLEQTGASSSVVGKNSKDDNKSVDSYHVMSYEKFSKFVTEEPSDPSINTPSKRLVSRKRMTLLLCATIVLIGTSVAMIVPVTREAIDDTLKNAFQSTEKSEGRTVPDRVHSSFLC